MTDLQQSILEVLWSRTEATAEEVREALKPGHDLKDSTVRTLLRRLEARGYLTHRIDGKVYVYSARLRPHSTAARLVRRVIDRLCAGSVDQFLIGMVDERILSVRELRRLLRKVEKRK